MLQHALVVVAEDTLAVDELHLGDGGLAGLGVEAGDVHALGLNGLAHDFAELVVAHGAGVGGLAP